jgi:AraC-like DNA-binding protein
MKKKLKEAIEYLREHPNMSMTKVADMFGCNRHTLAKHRDVDLSKITFEDEENYYLFEDHEKKALQAYSDGMILTEIQKEFGVSKRTIHRWRERFTNIPLRVVHQKRIFDRNKFNDIETEADAYWLGFLLADGYVNEERWTVTLKLGLKDYSHLEKFIDFLEGENLEINKDKGGFGQTVVLVVLHSRTIVDNLIKQGVFQGKSGKEKPNLNIPPALYKHYLRGLVDGDGCLTSGEKRVIDLVGSEEIVTFFRDYVNENIIPLDLEKHSYIYEHGKIKRFTCAREEVVEEVFRFLYEDANVYLTRKYEIAMEYLHGRE